MIDAEGRDTKSNLCNACQYVDDFPVCIPVDAVFGDGVGLDNIVECSRYKPLSPSGTGFEEIVEEELPLEQDEGDVDTSEVEC